MSAVRDVSGDTRRNALRRSFLFLLLASSVLLLSSCASAPRLQPEISGLVAAHQWDSAVSKIEQPRADYGHGNYLLYYLDRGMLEQMTGHYDQSIQSFEKAKRRFEALYTRSVSAEAASWAVNDYELPYRGSDYEYVLVNVFQALNYIQSGRTDEALVEARDLDSKFRVVEERASQSGRRHFEDNGFARFFMGLIYESSGRGEDANDALISYRQALALYDGYYGGAYVPELLQERLLALGARFADSDLATWARRFPSARKAAAGLAGKSVVYLVHLVGYSPVKEEEMLPVPLGQGMITKIAVPRFVQRPGVVSASRLVATPLSGSGGWLTGGMTGSELGEDITDLAGRDLESRRALILSKAILRPGLKAWLETRQRDNVKKRFGEGAAGLFTLLGDLYNLFSEKADLRSWQSLPGQIRIARLVLAPGQYQLKVHELGDGDVLVGTEELGAVGLSAGETRFVVRRASR